MEAPSGWFYWALLSAVFASLTAIFAKVGLKNVDSDFATLLRTGIIILVLVAFVEGTGKWSDPLLLSKRTWFFLTLSALATGANTLLWPAGLEVSEERVASSGRNLKGVRKESSQLYLL